MSWNKTGLCAIHKSHLESHFDSQVGYFVLYMCRLWSTYYRERIFTKRSFENYPFRHSLLFCIYLHNWKSKTGPGATHEPVSSSFHADALSMSYPGTCNLPHYNSTLFIFPRMPLWTDTHTHTHAHTHAYIYIYIYIYPNGEAFWTLKNTVKGISCQPTMVWFILFRQFL